MPSGHPTRSQRTGRSRLRWGAAGAALVLIGGIANPVRAAQQVTLVGSVSDSLTGRPIGTVRVSAGPRHFALTDSSGTFRIDDVSPGTYELEVSRVGFHPRRYRVAIPGHLAGEVHLGSIALDPLPPRVVTVSGQLRNRRTGSPVIGAPIGLNGRPAAMSGDQGGFEVRTVVARPGELNRLTVRRIGYEALDYDFWFADEDSVVQLELELEPLAEELPEIIVEGERVVIGGARLAGFNRRREFGLGQFITRDDIDQMNPKEVTDIFRRISGFSVTGEGPARRITPHSSSCPSAVVYVDGVRSSSDNLDLMLTPDGIVGIEVFRSTSQLPPEYSIVGAESSSCAVVGIWTR